MNPSELPFVPMPPYCFGLSRNDFFVVIQVKVSQQFLQVFRLSLPRRNHVFLNYIQDFWEFSLHVAPIPKYSLFQFCVRFCGLRTLKSLAKKIAFTITRTTERWFQRCNALEMTI